MDMPERVKTTQPKQEDVQTPQPKREPTPKIGTDMPEASLRSLDNAVVESQRRWGENSLPKRGRPQRMRTYN